MAPLQNLLNLGNDARMNRPGRAEGNWCCRCTEDMLTPAAFEWLHELTKPQTECCLTPTLFSTGKEHDYDRRHQVTYRATGLEGP